MAGNVNRLAARLVKISTSSGVVSQQSTTSAEANGMSYTLSYQTSSGGSWAVK